MRRGIVLLGPAAVAVMIFYYLIPFLIVAGVPDFVSRLRPFLISGSVLLIALGLYQSSPAKRSEVHRSKLDLSVLWFSALVVFGLILFPEAIANFLANTLEDDVSRRKRVIFGSLLAFAFLVSFYLYGGSTVPNGQQPLLRLNSSNLASLKDGFNGSANSVRLLILVSPT